MSHEQIGLDQLEAAVTAVEGLDETSPLSAHADAFERVHEVLQRRLEDAT